jgi:hypothetical protein
VHNAVVKHLLERAYELAKSGNCVSSAQIVQALRRERYEAVDLHLAGAGLRRELNKLCREARAPKPNPEAAPL